ncbi:helix-turn-helix domain-containing protein [Streptomyces sp. MK5]|nr:helix-turn-helix domain-containing protein [Streptomyces sp. MK5]
MLECATGASNRDVAALLGVEEHTVSRWRALPGCGPHPGPRPQHAPGHQ